MDVLRDETVLALMDRPETVEPDPRTQVEIWFEATLEACRRGLL